MTKQPQLARYAKPFWAGMALLLFVTICMRVGLSIDRANDPVAVELMRLFSFFTIQSNVLLCVVAGALALNAQESRPGWRIAWLDARAGIVLAGVVYFILLRPDDHQEGLSIFTNLVFHYVAPILAIAGWAAFGPFHRHEWRDMIYAFIWPAAWVIYTLIHGEISGWYPYDFIDVVEKGYAQVFVNLIGNTLFVAGLIALFIALDNRWRRCNPEPAPLGAR